MTDSIPEDLKPGYAPDPRSLYQILLGVFLVVTSPLIWEVGIAMDPVVANVWREFLPIAPFGQFFPSILPSFLESMLSDPLVRGGGIGGKGGNIGAVLALWALFGFGLGTFYAISGIVWAAAEYYRSAWSS